MQQIRDWRLEVTWMGPRQSSHCSCVHNDLFQVGTVLWRVLKCTEFFCFFRNRVNHRVPKISKLHLINEVELEHRTARKRMGVEVMSTSDRRGHCTCRGLVVSREGPEPKPQSMHPAVSNARSRGFRFCGVSHRPLPPLPTAAALI